MVTLEGVTAFAERVERNAAAREPIDWRRVFVALLSALPYLLGRVVGCVVVGVRIMSAAARDGYAQQATTPPAGRRPLVSTSDS